MADGLAEEISEVSVVRQHVLEVIRPFYVTRRVVNTDNYYTSVQLPEALRVKGLYGRGTVRGTSKHLPRHLMLDKDASTCGDTRMGVSRQYHIMAASWSDGSIVSMVSNADASTMATVTKLVCAENREYQSPLCVKNYNSNMQGVDRHDQLRARFSVADGHSFEKWHKKLSLAIIDIAQCNAFVSKNMVCCGSRSSTERDLHRTAPS